MGGGRATTGFTVIEVMMAVLLLSVVALALTNTLVASQRALTSSGRSMQAIQLAAAGLEHLLAGQRLSSSNVPAGFTCSGAVGPWQGHRGLYRIEVTVAWNDGEPRSFRLATLARR